jgi:hypothetical protein
MSAWLPTAFKSTIETVIADSITGIDNKATTLPFIVTANGIETNPTARGLFPFTGKILF